MAIELPAAPTGRTLSVQARSCVELDGSKCVGTASGVEWLEYREQPNSPIPVWEPMASGLEAVVPAGSTKFSLQLRAKRATIAAVTAAARGPATLPPLVIEVADDLGSLVLIPADVEVEPLFGLWAGKVELTRVSAHTSIQDIPLDKATATPLGMTLIVDLPSPSEVSRGSVPGLLDTVTIETFRDGRSLQRRLSSVLFDRPVLLAEDGADPLDPLGGAGTLRGSLHMLPEDPLNPYRHRYNPEHRAGYDIRRDITIQLEAATPSIADELAGLDGTFGPHQLGGSYTEVITGISQQPITVQGRFRLERIRNSAVSP